MAKITQSLMVLLAIFALSGCDHASKPISVQQHRQPNAEPSFPEGLVYCSEGNPETFNPQLTTSGTSIDASSKQLYNRLLTFNGDQLMPSLATGWHISEDGLRVRLTLRQDVQFHHTDYFQPTRPLNADDVLFSFERILNAAHPYHYIGGGQYPYFDGVGFREAVSQVRRLNDHNVEFILRAPSQHFLSDLSADFAVIHSAEYAEQLLAQGQPERLDSQPIGTGPFELSAFIPHNFIRYQRHSEYWKGPIPLPKLLFEISPSPTTRLIKLIGGDCDIAALPQSSELDVLQHHAEIGVDGQPSMNIAFWAFNTTKPHLNNPLVRQALALAVNQKRILNAIYNDMAEGTSGILPPNSWVYAEHTPTWAYPAQDPFITHNPARAKELLQLAGVQDLELSVWATPNERRYNPSSIKTAQLIQQDLARIGVKLRIQNDDPIAFRPKLLQGDYDSVLIGWSADTNDPDNFYSPLLSCNGRNAGTNFSLWCDVEFDRLILEARQASTQSERARLYQVLNQQVQQQIPLFPLAHAYRIVGRNQKWQGSLLPSVGGIDFSTVTQRRY